MPQLRFGVALPFGTARAVAEMAAEAEAAGWDGFFVGEALWHNDAWIALTAAAMRTSRIRLGTFLSPLPSMNPRKLASETATLDNLSGGRVILSVGMGATWMGYQGFPDEVVDTKMRAALLDEGIDILTRLYEGQPFDYDGTYHRVRLTAVAAEHYPPRPVQRPRIPIWVVGVWPRMTSLRRSLRCDGLIPAKMDDTGRFVDLAPADIVAMRAYVDAQRTPATPFDIVVEGSTLELPVEQAAAKIAPWAAAGATWWLDAVGAVGPEALVAHIRRGPPRA